MIEMNNTLRLTQPIQATSKQANHRYISCIPIKPYFNYILKIIQGNDLQKNAIEGYFMKNYYQPLEINWLRNSGAIVCKKEFLIQFHFIQFSIVQSFTCTPQPRTDPRYGLGFYAAILPPHKINSFEDDSRTKSCRNEMAEEKPIKQKIRLNRNWTPLKDLPEYKRETSRRKLKWVVHNS